MTDDPTDVKMCGGVPFAPTAEEEAEDAYDIAARMAREHPATPELRAIMDAALRRSVAIVPDPRDAEVERLREALQKIADWCGAYPIEMFPQDAADHALDACKRAGIPVGAMHASWARHLLGGIGRDARAALAAPAAQDDRSAPEDRERWIAEWMRKQREAGDA